MSRKFVALTHERTRAVGKPCLYSCYCDDLFCYYFGFLFLLSLFLIFLLSVCVCETFVPKRIVPCLFLIQCLQVQAFIPITAGGQCMPDSHCPTKTLSVHGDIWPDQPDVPATVCMEKCQVRFCKSNYLRRCDENCVLGRCPPHLSELRSAEP